MHLKTRRMLLEKRKSKISRDEGGFAYFNGLL